MRSLTVFSSLLLGLLCQTAQAQADGPRTFQQLHKLVGRWEGASSGGKPVRIEYRSMSAGTALLEIWQPGTARETMTVYHLDGDTLLADHFCAQGNVPRLAMSSASADGRVHFRLRDGANLRVAGKSHQHLMSLHLLGPDKLALDGTYLPNGAAEAELVSATPDPTLLLSRMPASR